MSVKMTTHPSSAKVKNWSTYSSMPPYFFIERTATLSLQHIMSCQRFVRSLKHASHTAIRSNSVSIASRLRTW